MNKNHELRGEEEIFNAGLETFPNPGLNSEPYWISITHPEFTCKCPRTGYPDFATIKIEYIPDKVCLELKSFKLYINSFRDSYGFHEDMILQISRELIQILDPIKLIIIGDFLPRGNVHTVIRREYVK